MISVRRFLARPSAVSLSATGMNSPRPPPSSTCGPRPQGVATICRAMSMQPSATAAAGRSVSFSQSRSGACAQVAAGVAWVSRAVLTIFIVQMLAGLIALVGYRAPAAQK